MEEQATRHELNGLGKRVTAVEQIQAVQVEKNATFRKDIDFNEQCITEIFKEIGMLREQISKVKNKIIGGVAAIVFLLQIITVVVLIVALKP